MSLPARQQRVIDNMEGALRAGEPHLASMFSVFARLNQDEPVAAEALQRARRRWWLPPGNAMYAIVLIPVMFATIIIGALLGGGARSTHTCDVGYSVGGGSAVLSRSRASCPAAAKTRTGTTAGSRFAVCAAAPSSTGRPGSAAGPMPAARFVTRTASEQALSAPSRADAPTPDASGVC
jgi:hypothetical protein